jgi:hypothetical protein
MVWRSRVVVGEGVEKISFPMPDRKWIDPDARNLFVAMSGWCSDPMLGNAIEVCEREESFDWHPQEMRSD